MSAAEKVDWWDSLTRLLEAVPDLSQALWDAAWEHGCCDALADILAAAGGKLQGVDQ